MPAAPDLDAYLTRLGLPPPGPPSAGALGALHRAHLAAIPFENLDVQAGRPIRLDLPSLEDKLVHRRRGGYCFEQNTLFQHVLSALGYGVMACEARVRLGAAEIRPRTHMALLVTVDGLVSLCDVGFGGEGPLAPVPLSGATVDQDGDAYRVVPEGRLQVLQTRGEAGWTDLYAFEPEARHPVDFEMANWFTSTWPGSHFVQTLTAQRALPGERHVLRNLSYSVRRGRTTEWREIARGNLPRLLRDTFGLNVDAEARYRALDPGT